METKPSDEEILEFIRGRRGDVLPTYFIKNMLRGKHPGLTTAWVRRRLMALEKAGKVVRAPTTYAVMICWDLVAAARVPTKPLGMAQSAAQA